MNVLKALHLCDDCISCGSPRRPLPQTFWLKAFVEVDYRGSMRAAARSLGVDVSTIQRALTQLEEYTGHPLISTSPGRGAELTGVGRALVSQAQHVLMLLGTFPRATSP